MPKKEKVIQIITDNYPYLASEFGVKKVGLFGSYAKDLETKDSDLDVIIELGRPMGFRFNELSEYFENIFEKKVDIITHDGLKNIRIEKIADNIRGNIIYV